MSAQQKILRVAKCPVESLAYTNLVIVSPLDLDASVRYIVLNSAFVFSVKTDPSVQAGEIGTNQFHRKWAQLSLNQQVTVDPYDPIGLNVAIPGASMTFEITTAKKNQQIAEVIDADAIIKLILNNFVNQIFTVGQPCVLEYHGVNYVLSLSKAEVMSIESMQRMLRGDKIDDMNADTTYWMMAAPSQPSQIALLLTETSLALTKGPDAQFKLQGDAKKAAMNPIIQPNFKFEDMGIGGLDSEFSAIFRRAFASRIFPPAIVEKLGIQHVKGILMYGPPGTGKTLMARQIAKMLNAREPLIVNGPEILNKFVGQSEENVRKLFAPAEQEYKEKGEESSLHIIIFDELDAICKQRGSKNDGTGVGDSIVNQLLSKLDGVEQLNNILVIGMTNRLDMIDEALVRPGRLELKLEISLPDEPGRFQIFKIHTKKMRDNNLMDPDVDLSELATLTKNFSGAEIAGLVKSATSFAFNRHIKVGDASVSTDLDLIKVNRSDFIRALEEVPAAYGASEQELGQCVPNGIVPFGTTRSLLERGALFIKQVRESSRTPLVSVLLHGPSGSGKTALAATIAMSSEFPFIKLVSPESMVGFNEQAKAAQIAKVFNDSYKSPMSVIVVDNLERLLEWVPIGPRLSNTVLQTLLVLLKRAPPKGKKLLILCTCTSRSVLQQLDMADCFNSEMYVANVADLDGVREVTKAMELFGAKSDFDYVFDTLARSGLSGTGAVANTLSVPVKKLLMDIEMARQDEDPKSFFIETITAESRRL
ncbi:P-loop containing nucleoside triphosphate hydrolase protein [Catenaria anguillulae PL171]|uniref:Vesicular-fusion protein SEC18 n=1 Tax=Catenaria anguillulae PL171 TaxID=765915 RepID=A0A1Y2H8K7_9FUNG|nr:P-loop containing nucleoside triphosphate hydrolase protein [Catenaria anguillulae PL171]